MVQEDAKSSSPTKPPRSHKRLLSFNITFHMNKDKDCPSIFHITDVVESQTLGDLKVLMINQNRDELAPVAESLGIHSDVASMKEAIQFEGMPNSSGLTDDVSF